jgi:hypothetical protein
MVVVRLRYNMNEDTFRETYSLHQSTADYSSFNLGSGGNTPLPSARGSMGFDSPGQLTPPSTITDTTDSRSPLEGSISREPAHWS